MVRAGGQVWRIAALSLGLGWIAPAGIQVAMAQDVAVPSPLAPIEDPVSGGVGGAAETGQLPRQTIEAEPGDGVQVVVAPVLTVDQDQLFTDSAWGRRTQARLEEEGGKIAAENDRLAAQLSQEEEMLTRQRASLTPAEFRQRAEAFDARATEVRRERAQAVQRLNDWAAADRMAFYRAALPVMGEMMQQRRAVAVLDRRTVFVSLDVIDITADLVTELDRVLGDGGEVVPFESAPSAAEDAAPAETPRQTDQPGSQRPAP